MKLLSLILARSLPLLQALLWDPTSPSAFALKVALKAFGKVPPGLCAHGLPLHRLGHLSFSYLR